MKKAIKSVVSIAIISTLILTMCSCSIFRKRIDFEDYIEITYSSFNGHAYPHMKIDKSAIEDEITDEKLSKYFSKVCEQEYKMYSAWGESVVFSDIFEVEFAENYKNLSNGDEIIINILPSAMLEDEGETIKSIQKGLGIKIDDTEIKIKVSGLEDAFELDLFEDIANHVTFEGANGYGEIKFNYPDDYERQIGNFYIVREYGIFKIVSNNQQIATYTMSCDNENLSNGDNAIVRIEMSDHGTNSLANYGSVVKSMQCAIKTPDLGEYIKASDELSIEEMMTLKDKIMSEQTNVQYMSTYFATIKKSAVSTTDYKCKLVVFGKKTGTLFSNGIYAYTMTGLKRTPDGTLVWSDIQESRAWAYDEKTPTSCLSTDFTYENII